ncbi:T9SS type A sorting domain-containing protein [Bacteroidota bacterium]
MLKLKNKYGISVLIISVIIFSFHHIQAQTIWNIKEKYGTIDHVTLQAAVNAAIVERTEHPDQDIILLLSPGTYYLGEEIVFPEMNKEGTGWLIIQGQGEDSTILVDTEYDSDKGVTFDFTHPYRFKLCELSILGERLVQSQGTIVNIEGNMLDIELDPGFPTPDEMFEVETTKANKIRRMLDTDLNSPHYIEGPDNDHQSERWTFAGDDAPEGRPVLVSGNIWRFWLNDDSPNPFIVGDRVGVSSKSNRGNWAFFRGDGTDIVVENIYLSKTGRVKFRNGWNNIHFINFKIGRPEVNGKEAFYSAEAGPQFGHESDGVNVYNLVMENCDIRGTVDDGSAFQRVVSGMVKNNYWEDGGGTLVGESCSDDLVFKNNIHYHCPLEDERPGAIHFKGAYNPEEIYDENGAPDTLSWSPGSRTNIYDVYFGTNFPLPLIGSTKSTTFSVDGLVDSNTAYYWRINGRNTTDSLGINLSDIWSPYTSLPSSITQIKKASEINLFPNPVMDELSISGITLGRKIIRIIDLLGKEILMEEIHASNENQIVKLNVENLKPGVYILNIGSESKLFIKK